MFIHHCTLADVQIFCNFVTLETASYKTVSVSLSQQIMAARKLDTASMFLLYQAAVTITKIGQEILSAEIQCVECSVSYPPPIIYD